MDAERLFPYPTLVVKPAENARSLLEGAAGARRREEGVVEGNEEALKQGSGTGQMGAEQTECEAD